MDEDYDAVDLENWFLAMQSADGSVMIPSFHRPSAIRIDSTVTPAIYDWGGPQNAAWENAAPGNWNDSASRILRPRAADGHDASAFPDLVPDATGKITYDVDNDGDGITDSVWVDLGYPARRNAQGQLYKPLFAFMVIGLNGRIPLNTAGNLAGQAGGIPFPLTLPPPAYTYGGGAAHAAHLGNSVSEVDPTYALQNGYDPNFDAPGAFNYPPTITAVNTQVDSAGIDVRLTQLRNLLAGTRPPQKTTLGTGTDGDTNYVSVETAPGSGLPRLPPLVMPNGVADPADAPPVFGTDASGGPVVQRLTPPVAGRWGEANSIPGGISVPGFPSPPAINNYVNLVHANYVNSVRAGYSYVIADILTTSTNEGFRDAADDNLNAFDTFPPGHIGELNDQDYYDAAGALDSARRPDTPVRDARRHQRHRVGDTLDFRHRRGGRPPWQGELLQLLSSPRLSRIDRLVAEHGDPSPNHWHPRRDLLSVERNRQQLLLYERAERQPGSASPGICTSLSDIPSRRDQ